MIFFFFDKGAWRHVSSTRTCTQKMSYLHVFPEMGRFSPYAQGKNIMFSGKNTIFPDNTRKIMRWRGPFGKTIFSESLKKIYFRVFFKERSAFIFHLRCKIIFSEKRNIIFPNNTRKIIFQRNFFGKTIFSGRPEKGNIVFGAVILLLSQHLSINLFLRVLLSLVVKLNVV